jgi:type IV secretion system protein VirB10
VSENDHPLNAQPGLEREELVGARRARQQGASGRGKNNRLVVSGVIILGGTLLFVIFAGPATALKFFSGTGDASQKTSQVNMKVGKDQDDPVHLDFVVPAAAAPEKKEIDPNIALNEKFKALQDQLEELQRSKQPGVSTADIQNMLSKYNEAMTQKLDDERKALTEENARLRAQADQADQAKREADEAAKLEALSLQDRQKLDKKQRESNAVIVDGASGPVGQPVTGDLAGNTTGDTNRQDLNKNESFLKSEASSVVQTSMSQKLRDPSRTVVQGTIISGVLETAIDTQLPGNLRAQVMEPVYSFDGSRVLMPAGTTLIGEFRNDVDLAQKRVLIAWNRAITPDGQSIALGSTGTDTLGRAGTEGNVDNRYGTKFGAAILVSAITALPQVIAASSKSSSSGTTVNVGGGSQVASQAGTQIGGQASSVLDQYLSLPPVIRVPQGEEIRIFVNRDLVFK